MKKIVFIVIITLLALTSFSYGNVNTKKYQVTNIETVAKENAIISKNEDLPVKFVQNSEEPDFKKYFSIRDQRIDIEVLDEYINKGDFNIAITGFYQITIAYTGQSSREMTDFIDVEVILKDVTAPQVYRIREGQIINSDVNRSLKDFYTRFSIRDDVDGSIASSNDFIVGLDQVDITLINKTYNLQIAISDRAGNETVINFVLNIVDQSAPLIYDAVNLTTRAGKEIDYKGNLRIEDNYYKKEQITVNYTLKDLDGNEVSTIDFSKVGEYKIEVTATDLSGNISPVASYKLIIENGLTLGTTILLVNVIAGVIVAAIGATYFLVRKVQRKKNKESNLEETK